MIMIFYSIKGIQILIAVNVLMSNTVLKTEQLVEIQNIIPL